MNKISGLVGAVSMVALLAATSASALTVSTGAVGDVQVGSNASPSTGVNVNVTGSGSTGASDQNSSSGGSTGANSSANADIAVPLVVTQADVSNGTVQATSVAAGSVVSDQDLSGYIATKMQSDAQLSAVDTATDHVAVTYPERAELFGFIPVTVETTATTDASGTVSVTQPWWSFLAATDNVALQSSVQANVQNVLGASTSTNAQLTASQQAQLVTAIQSAMSAALSASANTSANMNSQ